MGKVKYTKEQERVIDFRNGNLLVSAAAGSGKTAVLVERIIKMIENKEASITELLVLTFTKASALEMRERVGSALYEKFLATGDPLYREQMLFLSVANISTFHAFCLKLIKNYFYKTGLDTYYYLADEQMISIFREQAMAEVMERNYEKMSADFAFLDEKFEGIGTYSAIQKIVLDLYFKAISMESPREWLESLSDIHNMNEKDDYFKSVFFAYIYKKAIVDLEEIELKCKYANEFIENYNIEHKAVEDIRIYSERIAYFLDAKEELAQRVLSVDKIPNAKPINKKALEDPIMVEFKALREDIKDRVKTFRSDFISKIFDEESIKYQKHSHAIVKALSALSLEFLDEFGKIKSKNSAIDYSDIEQIALKIVYDGDEISDEAKEIRDSFKEILIDEYQDTNYVQEKLISGISKESIDKPNVFMVGDLKQSIYKFRNSAPEIFASKFKSYSRIDSERTVISLNQNFRSRKNILHFINFVFGELMSEEVGDLTYDHEAMLYNGKKFLGDDPKVEIMLSQAKKSDIESEAFMVAKKIKELVENENYIYTKEDEPKRITYGDIAILVRAAKGRVEIFNEVFKKMNIPLLIPSKTGFFGALEISTLLNILLIIGNPLQDLPLLSVLKSPIFSFTDDELVEIKYSNKDLITADFFFLLKNYADENNPKLLAKIHDFLSLLNKWSILKNELFVHELLDEIIISTRYMNIIALGNGGQNAVNNVKTLLSQSVSFESREYKGLAAFNEYIAKLKKKNIDFGLSNNLEIDDFVSIMSIHNSKGLEFPVVFLSTMHKEFNMQDTKAKLLIHDKLGVGVDMYIPDEEIVLQSPIKKVIRAAIKADSLSEELRLLYVALTRARERLYLTASVKEDFTINLEKVVPAYRMGEHASPYVVSTAKTMLDFMLIALARSSALDNILAEKYRTKSSSEPMMSLCIYELEKDEQLSVKAEIKEEKLDTEIKDKILENIGFTYSHMEKTKTRLRTTVSAIKSAKASAVLAANENELVKNFNGKFSSNNNGDIEEKKPVKKEFKNAGKSDKITGAKLGTLYHEIMRIIDFRAIESLDDVEKFLLDLVDKNALSQKEYSSISPVKIFSFFTSDIGKRARTAALRNELFRERTFVLGEDIGEGDMYMVQGMIDMYFIENDEIILLDYKTDRISEQILISRYSEQMKYYKRALKGFSDLEVSEVYLYSFELAKNITVNI